MRRRTRRFLHNPFFPPVMFTSLSSRPSLTDQLRANRVGKVACLTLCIAWLSACQQAAPPPPVSPQPILQGQQIKYPASHAQLALLSTAPAKPATQWVVELPARLVWNENRTQRVFPAFAGRVSRIAADVGQTVSAGTALAQLASPEFGAAQAETARALADVQLAQKQLQRQQSLFESGIVARKDLEQAQADAARASAELERAQARIQLYGGQASVNQQLVLSSGGAGVVVERNINPGQEVRPDQGGPGMPALFVITDPSSLWVQIDAHERDLPGLRPGNPVELRVPSLPQHSFTARIDSIADFIDPQTRTIKVRAEVANPQRLLKSDMLGTVRLQQRIEQGVSVPASAVLLQGTQHTVFVKVEAGVFEPRPVKVGHEDMTEVLVVEGLRAGEEVVQQNGLLLAREFKSAREALEGKPTAERKSP